MKIQIKGNVLKEVIGIKITRREIPVVRASVTTDIRFEVEDGVLWIVKSGAEKFKVILECLAEELLIDRAFLEGRKVEIIRSFHSSYMAGDREIKLQNKELQEEISDKQREVWSLQQKVRELESKLYDFGMLKQKADKKLKDVPKGLRGFIKDFNKLAGGWVYGQVEKQTTTELLQEFSDAVDGKKTVEKHYSFTRTFSKIKAKRYDLLFDSSSGKDDIVFGYDACITCVSGDTESVTLDVVSPKGYVRCKPLKSSVGKYIPAGSRVRVLYSDKESKGKVSVTMTFTDWKGLMELERDRKEFKMSDKTLKERVDTEEARQNINTRKMELLIIGLKKYGFTEDMAVSYFLDRGLFSEEGKIRGIYKSLK